MYLVYEYVEKGSLRNVLYGVEGKTELDWSRRVKILQGVLMQLLTCTMIALLKLCTKT
jgi:hypothetical protein